MNDWPIEFDDTAKDLMEAFLTGPRAGSPWEVSYSVGTQRAHWTRGNLIELDAAKNGPYKDHDWLDVGDDHLNPNEGLDFRGKGPLSNVVTQQTSTQTASARTYLVEKLKKSAEKALDEPGVDTLVFDVHINQDKSFDTSALDAAVDELKGKEGFENLEVVVQVTKTPDKWID